MPAICPLCHASVNDDFGLQECPGCGANLLVHMDGHVEYKGVDATQPRIEEPAAEEEKVYEGPPPLANENVDLVPPVEEHDFLMPEDQVVIAEQAPQIVGGQDSEELFREIEDSPAEEEVNAETILQAKNENTTFDFDTPPDSAEEEATPPPPVYNSASPGSPDLSDVAAFGNSEMSGGRDGSLRYNIIIEGIDTADVREAFREAITDRKFVWDIDQILRSVRNGKVQIHNVAPTKGYILVSRLRGLPLKIRWEQYAIQQT